MSENIISDFYLVKLEYNKGGRICNYHTDNDETEENASKVLAEEWERFSLLSGRQHKLVDGIVIYDETLMPCLPDSDIQLSESEEIKQLLLDLISLQLGV